MARKGLTPSLSNLALSIDPSACCPFWASLDIQNILSLPPLTSPPGLRPLLSVQWNFPSREPKALSPARLSLPFTLPDAHFPWESRLLRTAAAASPACSCCSKAGQHGSAVLPLRTDFFFIYPWKSYWAVPTVGTVSAAPCLSLMLLLRDPLYSGSSWVAHSRQQPRNSFWWF